MTTKSIDDLGEHLKETMIAITELVKIDGGDLVFDFKDEEDPTLIFRASVNGDVWFTINDAPDIEGNDEETCMAKQVMHPALRAYLEKHFPNG